MSPADRAALVGRRVTTDARSVLTDWNDPLVRQRVCACAVSFRKELRGVASAYLQNSRRRAYARDLVLQSFNSRFCALIRALAQRGKKCSLAEAQKIATGLNAWSDSGEPIHILLVKKGSGGFRPTACFGVRRLALSYLCQSILLAIWGPPEHDYNWRGRGAERAIGALRECIENDRPWIVTSDVKDCFPSFRQEGLQDYLPLPKNVVLKSILIPEGASIVLPSGTVDGKSVRDTLRLGIPQGAPASSLIVAHVMEEVLGSSVHHSAVGLLADNIFAAFEHKKDAVQFTSALAEAVAGHPAGELTLHDTATRHIDQGTQLFGYTIKSFPSDAWRTHAHPCHRNYKRHWDRLSLHLAHCASGELEDAALRKTQEWISGWKQWNPSAARVEDLLDFALKLAADEKAKRELAENASDLLTEDDEVPF